MLSLLAADVVERFLTMLWPMARISALLLVAPVLSLDAVTLRIRIALALVLTVFVYPLFDWPVIDPTTAPGLLELVNQITIGILMGLILQVVLAAVATGGQAIAGSMGLSMAQMIDPNLGNVPVVASFLVILASLIFLGLGGHVLLLELLIQSFEMLPIGQGLLSLNAVGALLGWSSMIFLGAVLLALPMLVILLAVNLGLGVVVRAAPTLNIFAVGFPAMILVGMLMLYVLMGAIGGRMQWLWSAAFAQVRTVLGLG
ncbi:MAG: flagellar biosynthetic protein FliR [Proteobacteria bacterium]|jgi:flagellar biosynthesis protein FliR|nr:flagellar biosynthetic protein FliR [Pseudomonadota bacterium]MDA0847840.1 flagellar biosynthetic protein FliR [Pseudomonadota bacterium]MDP4576970.1 flagellar biosynthetic protein FliR [Burkholderiaceae bacterium]MDP4801189.1 flagellar biosynthetic protein FliR [Burkholderiaceae bacterium]